LLPNIAARMERPTIFMFLLLTAVCTFIVQGLAVYLRSFKQEPYLLQSTAIASLTVIGALLVAPQWGSAGVAVVYFVCSGILGLLWAVLIFAKQREQRCEVRI
jgi:O-antigen/teichoic acid export membrane protein